MRAFVVDLILHRFGFARSNRQLIATDSPSWRMLPLWNIDRYPLWAASPIRNFSVNVFFCTIFVCDSNYKIFLLKVTQFPPTS
jgi:hypothetical protein